MNKKIISILSIGLICFYGYGMESENKPTKYLEHPQEYTRFKEKKIIQRSNFACLPEEILENHIKPHLVRAVSTHFKHRLLNHKWQECYSGKIPSPINSPIVDSWKPFTYHDGTYTIVPDIAEYATWDGGTNKYEYRIFQDDKQNFYNTTTILSHADAQSTYSVCCPSKERELLKNKKTLYVAGPEKNFSILVCTNPIVSHLLSADGKWLAHCCDDAMQFFNIITHELAQKYTDWPSIIAFCTAHHSSLFAVCSQGMFSLATSEKIIATVINLKPTFTCIQFSPNDHHLCMNNDRSIVLCDVSNVNGSSFGYGECTTSDDIRKIFFSPDSTRILVAFKYGRLCCGSNFFKNPILELGYYVDHVATWRCADVADIDNQAPRVLWSNKDELLFSLDPADHTDRTIFNFVIRDSNTGMFLNACNFYPRNPIAMGLTKDEGSVIFVHKDHSASQLNLYSTEDNVDINFIEHKASLYELCCLWQVCKNIKVDMHIDGLKDKNARLFVNTIRSQIADMSTKQYLN